MDPIVRTLEFHVGKDRQTIRVRVRDDGYRITYEDPREPGTWKLWAEYKQADDPFLAAGIAGQFMGRPQCGCRCNRSSSITHFPPRCAECGHTYHGAGAGDCLEGIE